MKNILLKGASMFASGGIGEIRFEEAGLNIVVANELLKKRADFYRSMHKSTEMICGDIRNVEVKNEFLNRITDEVKFLIATPPCQGISNLGKNRNNLDRLNDRRNYLFFDVLDVIDVRDFDYILIENVPGFLKLYLPYDGEYLTVIDILNRKYNNKYNIEFEVLNAKDYGVPQSRPRAIIKLYKKGLIWSWPQREREITLYEAIGDLPSLESEDISDIPLHYARKHTKEHVLWMKHTPTSKSAHENPVYYPKKMDGTRIKGFGATYKRMSWDKSAPAMTMRSDAISSQENVHPGRLKEDGTYSDARVLSLLELFIVSTIPTDWPIPDWVTDTFMRQIIGEAIPPKMSFEIIKRIGK